ncbi:MAG: phenylacetate--CoA ligase family protein [Anaerolineales bacterium]|nr:phenylacetate--CoA ligase family protein [Anaerolineales bacterium]
MTQLTPLHPWIAHTIGCAPDALTRAALEAYQLRRLQETLDWCRARSAFYRERLASMPPVLASLADWAAVPLTEPDAVAKRPFACVCVSQSEIARVVTLPGTPPRRVFLTAEEQERTRDFFHVGMGTFAAPGDRVLILLPCARPGSVGDLLAEALARLGARAIRHGLVTDMAQALAVLAAKRPDGVVGVPGQVLALARAAGGPVGVRYVLLSGAHAAAAVVAEIEALWGCTVYDHYGTTEMGLGGGVECAARQGYHLREADLYVEVVDPRSGAPLPEGTPGEVVFTTLTRHGMPLLRYRTGDRSRFLPGACACGTTLRRLQKIGPGTEFD